MADEGSSILRRLETRGRTAPRVRLASEGEPAGPVLRQTGRFEILGDLASGGVGDVIRGRDVDLGRDVALKVLRVEHADNPDLVQRFVDEAQIGGQLQHPGVVPVYELGLGEDQRPFFAMKLVKGRTFAAMLADRADPSRERRRFLQVFEQVCQTVAYAHDRGVIHRDLKPSNVMVGAFGEVQVLDWGFAKVLARGGVGDERAARSPDLSRVETLRSGSAGSKSLVGSVMGTPAYMPPEQARGRVEEIDERSDVFSLGAILCEILTGRPPYGGDDLLMQALHANLVDALARLDACGAEDVLVRLAKACLSPLRKDRPRNAGAVAATVHAHLEEADQRAHRAALAAAEAGAAAAQARAEAAQQRRSRRLGVIAAIVVLLALGIGGGSWLTLASARRGRVRRTTDAVVQAMERAQGLRGDGRLAEAAAAAEQAEALARDEEVDAATRERAAALATSIATDAAAAREEEARAERDRVFLARLEDLRLQRVETLDVKRADQGFAVAFAQEGIDVATPSAAEAAVRESHPAIATGIAAALDEWASLRLRQKALADRDALGLLGAAKAIDPDPLRNALRDAVAARDVEALRALAGRALAEDLPTPTLDMVGMALQAQAPAEAAAFYRQAWGRHPDDFWVATHAANAPSLRPEERLPFLRAALALRPRSAMAHGNLGGLFLKTGDVDEAVAEMREGVRLAPDSAVGHYNLAAAVWRKKLLEEAVAEFREAIRLDPEFPMFHVNFGVLLGTMGRRAEALERFREAVRLAPTWAVAHFNVGNTLWQMANHDAAIPELREAVRLLPSFAGYHGQLGAVLVEQGRMDEGIVELRESVRLDPLNVNAQFNLGNVLLSQGRLPEALEHLRLAGPTAADLVRQAEDMMEAEGRLPGVLAGTDRAKDVGDALTLARLCHARGLFAAAADFFREALAGGGGLQGDDLARERYSAACAAVKASAGKGEDAAALAGDVRAGLRGQALEWMRAALEHRGKAVATDPVLSRRILTMWLAEADLSDVRGEAALERLPAAERAAWASFWADVRAALEAK